MIQGSGARQHTFSFSDLSTVVEVARGESPIGAFLRQLPDSQWLLPAADRWAAQEADYQEKHNIPNRLPLPDPWQYLLDAPVVSPGAKAVCRSAQSWIWGLRRLCRLATGVATLKTDWLEDAEKAKANGNLQQSYRAMTKIADKLSPSPVFQKDTQEHAAESRIVQQMQWYVQQRRAKIVHRPYAQRAKADSFNPKFRLTEIERDFPLEFLLVESWMCFPNGGWPGLMWWGNKAVTKWVLTRLHRNPNQFYNDGRGYIKKIRQRLGLLPVSDKSPWVWDVTVKSLTDGGFEITGWGRNGNQVFNGKRMRSV